MKKFDNRVIGRIKHWHDWLRNEERLIRDRLSWLLGTNGFLAASFAIIGSYSSPGFMLFYSVVIGLTGIAICYFSLSPIYVALDTMDTIREKLNKCRQDKKIEKYYFFRKRSAGTHKRSWKFSTQIPCAVMLMWVCLILIRGFQVLHPYPWIRCDLFKVGTIFCPVQY